MREIFSDKNFARSKILMLVKFVLVVSLFIFFLPLLILPFFNHPFADDYFYGYQLADKGFAAYQTFIYTNWDGRFAQTFTTSIFTHQHFLYSHYYLHSLFLLLFNFLSVFSIVNVVNKFILKEKLSFLKRLLLSFLLLALEISCLPQCSTFMFWFSSAVTYQLPVILMQFEIALVILLFNSNRKSLQNICAVTVSLLVFISIGLNEFFLVAQLFLLCSIFYFKWYKHTGFFMPLFILAFLLSSCLLIFAPGNQVRMSDIDTKGFIAGAFTLSLHSMQTLWSIFKTPLIWFVCIAVFIYAQQTKPEWQGYVCIKKSVQKKWLLPIAIIVFLISSIALPVIALKGGIIPDRYLNVVVWFIAPLMLVSVFVAGVISSSKIIPTQPVLKKIFIYTFFIIGLLCNDYIIDAYKSIIIAPVYNIVLHEREDALKQAGHGNKIAVVKDYNKAISDLLQTKYNNSTATFKQLIQQKPPLLFFEDDLADDHSKDVLKKYYGLDSIVVEKY